MNQHSNVEQPAHEDGADKRQALRKKVLFTAKIVFEDGITVLDCAIRDISETGAKITLQSNRPVPSRFYLLDMPNRIAYHVEVLSVRTSGLGLKFLDTMPLAKINTPELRFLRRIWIAHAR